VEQTRDTHVGIKNARNGVHARVTLNKNRCDMRTKKMSCDQTAAENAQHIFDTLNAGGILDGASGSRETERIEYGHGDAWSSHIPTLGTAVYEIRSSRIPISNGLKAIPKVWWSYDVEPRVVQVKFRCFHNEIEIEPMLSETGMVFDTAYIGSIDLIYAVQLIEALFVMVRPDFDNSREKSWVWFGKLLQQAKEAGAKDENQAL